MPGDEQRGSTGGNRDNTNKRRKGMTTERLEALFRNYYEFRELYETRGLEEITLDGGFVVNIHDVLRGIDELPKRQREALILTCFMGLKEIEAAPIMGFRKWTSPVSSYKRLALKKLVEKYWSEPSGSDEDEPSPDPSSDPRSSS